ncbi:MAG TPA: glycosyltransferase 87 family protein [Acidimicrobiia bacterium]|nr:glycosyltransferase 87 family protein [Acidimicrobiia bacterium]
MRPARPAPRSHSAGAALGSFVVAAGAGTALSVHIARGPALLAARWWLLAEIALWALSWVGAVVAAFRLPGRIAVPFIFLAATALRLGAVAGPPLTSDDLFRYSWDGRVQAAGIDPYRYTPGSTHLTGLREPWLWPEQRPCPLAYRPLGCTRINRSWVHTIYPPGAEAWFAVVYRLTGIGARYKPWQVAGLLTDVTVVALLIVALRRRGRDPRWAALYALCPAPVVEIVNNGHVDGLAILLSVGALTIAAPPVAGRRRLTPGQREVLAGAAVGLAVLVKLFPALLVLAIAAAAPGRRGRALVRSAAAALAVGAAGYLPHVLAVGGKVIGFLPGYLREEHYDGAGRYLVATGLRIPGGLAGPASVVAVVAAAVWVWARRPPAPLGATVLLGTLLAAVSPVQPWYAATLLAFATLAVEPQWAAVTAAGYPYFFAVILLQPHRTGIGQVAYAAAAGVVVAVTACSRGRSGGRRPVAGWRGRTGTDHRPGAFR